MKENKIGVGFGVMVLKDNKVLLGQRHPDPKKASSELHGEGTWTMPGGKLHFGENFREGAARELMEETGLKITRDDLGLISLTDNIMPDVHFVTAGFLCTKFEGEPRVLEPEEIIKWGWFSLDALPNPMYPASLQVIENYKAGRIY